MHDSIRLATLEDAGGIQAIYAPFCQESPVSFETVPPTVEDMVVRISSVTATYPWLVATANREIRGYAYAGQHRARAAYRWAVDVAIYLHPDWRGQGLGQLLYTELFTLLRRQGFYKAYAGITLPNPASVALHQSLGFSLVGVFHGAGYKAGAWHDVSWWELALLPETANPADPLPIHRLRETEIE
jgi:L-amino acid N-acyltransferase YncA